MKRSTLAFGVAAFCLALAACTTARFRYDAEIETQDGKTATLRFEKSYDVTTDAVLCGVTGVLYGGWCWTYAFMPLGQHQGMVRGDVARELDQAFGRGKYTITSSRLRRVSWNQLPELADLDRGEAAPVAAASAAPSSAGSAATKEAQKPAANVGNYEKGYDADFETVWKACLKSVDDRGIDSANRDIRQIVTRPKVESGLFSDQARVVIIKVGDARPYKVRVDVEVNHSYVKQDVFTGARRPAQTQKKDEGEAAEILSLIDSLVRKEARK